MHRQLTFHGDSAAIRTLARELPDIEGVIALDHQPNVSLKPSGDVLRVHVLNRAADEVLRRARPHLEDETKSVVVGISQSTALIAPPHEHLIRTDADEVLWEEMESDLRNHGRISANYLLLMALGGVVACAGLMLEPVSQAIAFVGASIIAPAFEPVAKVSQSLVVRNFRVCGRALWSLAVGYAVLFTAAFLFFATLVWSHHEKWRDVLNAQPIVPLLSHLELAPLITSASAAVAGVIMVVSLRDLYVVGPLMVLVLIPGLALAAAGLAGGDLGMMAGALGRVGTDLALIVLLGAAVFYWKQRTVHRRRPLS